MTTEIAPKSTENPVIQSSDMVAGLGTADRHLLSTCIALFEDTALYHRMEQWLIKARTTAGEQLDKWRDSVTDTKGYAAVAASVASRAETWHRSDLSDGQLRLVLWIYLREPFKLPARTCVSTRAAGKIGDDLVAYLLHALGPGWWKRLGNRISEQSAPIPTLDSMARDTLEEMLDQVFDADDPQAATTRVELLADMKDRIQRLGDIELEALLEAVGADQLNDAVLRRILLTGGGLTAFSASVGMAGFSAYILAAQASAFIPLVSGPALVSLVSVISNPITVIALSLGGGWWATRSVQRKVHGAVATRVVSLLAMNGLISGSAGLRAMASAFQEMPGLKPSGDLKFDTIHRYQGDWRTLQKAWQGGDTTLPALVSAMDRPARGAASRFDKILGFSNEDWQDTAALSALTMGDMLFDTFAIDPAVMTAADFSNVGDLDNGVNFAAFADKVDAMSPAAHLGAVSDLKGYVGERVVAAQLVSQGHQVSFPDVSNQSGWDISIDGVLVQVKDTDSISYLGEHFAKYGDQYPVVVNAEMAKKLADHHEAWADHVYYVEGYSNHLVEHVTNASLHAGAAMDNPHVPTFSLLISGIRNYKRYAGGESTGAQAVEQILLDGSTKMTLAAAGGFVGPAIGLLLFGPAGALVLGAIVPIASQMQYRHAQGMLDRYLSGKLYRKWRGHAARTTIELVKVLRATLKTKADLLKKQMEAAPVGEVGDYLRWRLRDELAYLRESWCRLNEISGQIDVNVEVTVANLLQWLGHSTIHATAYQAQVTALTEVFGDRPTVGDRFYEKARNGTGQAVKWLKKFYRSGTGKASGS